MKNWRGKSGLVTGLGRIPLVCVLALSTVAPLGACSSEQSDKGVQDLGSLDVRLEAAPGVTLNSVTYTISGNGFSKTGTIDTSGSEVISGTIGGIPAGNGYTITLTATSVEDGLSFTGSAKFNVTAGATTSVSIHLKAANKRGTGNVTVNATLNVGPVIDELTVTPLTVNVGSSIALTAAGSDIDEQPSPSSYYWTSTGGVISDPISPNATLTSATPGQVLNTLPNYKAIIQSLDTSIGRLLEEVDLEKTTVIFIGDNGTPGNQKDTGTGIRGSKGSVYEGGVRVPLIVAGAGVTRRGREDALVGSADLSATILSLTGLSVSHAQNSYSIKPLLSDQAASSGRTHSFSETANGATQRYAIRDNRYKLLSNNKVRELYDLGADPLETTDLYSNPAYAAVRGDLEAEIAALAPNAPDGYFP